jgi:hypothetical protein
MFLAEQEAENLLSGNLETATVNLAKVTRS